MIYDQLNELLEKKDKKLLLKYEETTSSILNYENYKLANQIYKDLEQ